MYPSGSLTLGVPGRTVATSSLPYSVRSFVVVAILLGAPSLALAAGLQAQTAAAPQLPTLKSVKVVGVNRLGVRQEPSDTLVRAGIRHIIVLKVKNLDSLVRHAQCLSPNGTKVPDCDKRGIALYLDGREMRGLKPESGAPLLEEGELQYHLDRTTDPLNNEAWADLLGGPSLKRQDFYYRPTSVSVGLEDGYALPTDVDTRKFELVRLDRGWFLGSSFVFLLVLAALAWLAMYTGLLRDVGPEPTGTKPMKGLLKRWVKKKRKQYSLGRVQMAFWFVLVIGAFLFIWLVTGAHDTVTPSVLGLIGIGAGTGLGAAAIDQGQDGSNSATLAGLKAEKDPLVQEISELDTAVTNAAASPEKVAALAATRALKKARLVVISDKIKALEEDQKAVESKGFFRDILTDPAGEVGFHRFQMAVWTVVLGVLFLRSTWERLSMPEFSGTLLALLGLSVGTYLGFKIPERKVTPAAAGGAVP